MSGLALFKEINADPELKKIVFIMLTSSSEKEKEKVAIDIGITNYILKPFNANMLIHHTIEILEKANDT